MQSFVYPALVESVPSGGYSLFFPDLACFTGADDMPQLAAMAREALQLHLEGLTDDGAVLPPPSSLELLREDPEYEGLGVMLVEANLAGLPKPVIVSLPTSLLDRLDVLACSRGITRDQALAESAEALLLAN